jgi:carbon storage regulator
MRGFSEVRMLVLTRKIGQALVINKDIVVTVVRIEGDHVRIGIQAPKNVSILRQELIEEVRAETQQAQAKGAQAAARLGGLKELAAKLKSPGSDKAKG